MSIVEHPQETTGVPNYIATRAYTDELIGIGPDSALVVGNWLWLSSYVQHLAEPRLIFGTATVNAPSALALASYSEVCRHLEAFRTAPETDEFGRVRPSNSAIAAATRVTFSVVQAGLDMPMVEDVSTDSDGAIRILWAMGGRKLELICPFQPSQRHYWYYSDPENYRIEYEQSPELLRRLVSWLNGLTLQFPK
jgi:hypothetical protein